MSLPGANLVWHCPYIILFGGSDGKVGGADYEEYAVLKLNGESDGSNEYAENKLILKHRDDFPGWEEWKAGNRAGVECEVSVEKKGNRIVIEVENLGISNDDKVTGGMGPNYFLPLTEAKAAQVAKMPMIEQIKIDEQFPDGMFRFEKVMR